jgi:hypothetical protein
MVVIRPGALAGQQLVQATADAVTAVGSREFLPPEVGGGCPVEVALVDDHACAWSADGLGLWVAVEVGCRPAPAAVGRAGTPCGRENERTSSLGAVDVDLVSEFGQRVRFGDGLDALAKVLLAEPDADPLVVGGEGRLPLAVVTPHIST